MNIFAKISNAIGGSLFGEVKEMITDYFPPDMNPQQKAELQEKLARLEMEKTNSINSALADAEKTLNQRIAEQEGTASDLKQLPVIGRVVLFLRGLQRPLWGFFAMYLDFFWFTTNPVFTEQQQTALIVINILVLGFLFGERTIKNLSPLIIKVFGGKQ